MCRLAAAGCRLELGSWADRALRWLVFACVQLPLLASCSLQLSPMLRFLGFGRRGIHSFHSSSVDVLVVVRPCDGDAFGRICFLLVVSSPLDVPVFVRRLDVVFLGLAVE